ncbi:MAG: hypothetical protein CMK09_04490 [Ponticaulis sp.]|nr:hypothetical protein [Ponticaulis sp.]|tara:strand:+ start:43903 stop:44334 length:432 start_codon:yes stop_codon:yes gene_type:complete
MTRELKKILYLEDDAHIAEIAMLAMSEFSDFEVVHFDCGADAVENFQAVDPDLVLLDVMVPDMDGVETLAAIRLQTGGWEIPAVFMTAKAQLHEQKQYLEAGAISVIVKPFDAFSLAERLQNVWDDHFGVASHPSEINATESA